MLELGLLLNMVVVGLVPLLQQLVAALAAAAVAARLVQQVLAQLAETVEQEIMEEMAAGHTQPQGHKVQLVQEGGLTQLPMVWGQQGQLRL